MSTYIRSQSAGEILRNSIHLYRTNFRKLFLAYLALILPFYVTYALAIESNSLPFLYIAMFVVILSGLFAVVPITVMLSEICLGNQPAFARAFRRAFDRSVGQLFGTFFLSVGITLLGFLLCLIPGLVFGVWYCFALTVVALERIGGWKALKRSRELGLGFYWRNFGILFIFNMPIIAVGLFAGVVLGIVNMTTSLPPSVVQLSGTVLTLPLAPIPLVATVLMYYDMRARKEAYDSAALAEDLRR